MCVDRRRQAIYSFDSKAFQCHNVYVMRCELFPADLRTHSQLHRTPSFMSLIVFQYNRTAASVSWGETAGTADTPMAFLCGRGAYEVTWFS